MINYYQPRSFKNLEDEMKKTVLLVILAVFGILLNNAQAQGTNQRIAVSPAFATAQEAVDFANNSLPRGLDIQQFTCEYRSGLPTESFFKIAYHLNARYDPNPDTEWNFREFASPKEAVNFVNNNGSLPNYTICWNPTHNPAKTNVVVFFNQRRLGIEDEVYGPFVNPEQASLWANENTCNPHDVDFVSETNVATQTEPIWYVVTYKNLSCETKSNVDENWHVRMVTKDTESAATFVNSYEYLSEQYTFFPLGHIRLASAFNTWDITGRIVLFVLEPPVESELIKSNDQEKKVEPTEDTPKENDAGTTIQNRPELILPVRIFATKTLLEKYDSERLREITNTAVNSFHEQINFVRLETTAEIQQAPQIASSDPVILGNSLPYVPNTLAIFFTDQNLLIPKTSKDSERSITGRAGRSWVVMNVNVCDGCNIKPEGVLLHEILHEFGVPHKQDPTSVMCADLIIKSCPRNTMIIDGKSLAEANGAIKLIKKIGFDTYTGLATRF